MKKISTVSIGTIATFSAILLLSNQNIFASDLPYKLTVERDGKSILQIAYNAWSGEQPGPVIDVQSSVAGTTSVMGYSTLRKLDEKKLCTIENGIYHPWSETKNSVINYYTIVGVQDYTVVERFEKFNKTYDYEGVDLEVGDKLENNYYLAEGRCAGIYISKSSNQNKKLEEYHCNIIDANSKKFKITTSSEFLTEQWLHLKCKEGYNVFMRDEDMLSSPNVKEGEEYL